MARSLCAAITLTMEMQELLLNRLAGKFGWQYCLSWAMLGAEIRVVAMGESMRIAQSLQTSLNDVFR